jgi:hypothetical protein
LEKLFDIYEREVTPRKAVSTQTHDRRTLPLLLGGRDSIEDVPTYRAARLQTLDQGAPVSTFTVKELGHGGDALVKRVYGHLGETRHRSEVVEYRVKQHKA